MDYPGQGYMLLLQSAPAPVTEPMIIRSPDFGSDDPANLFSVGSHLLLVYKNILSSRV